MSGAVKGPLPVVYVVRPGNENPELLHSLRSLVNMPHGDVWIFGHLPPWARNVRHVFLPQRDPNRHKYDNVTANLQAVAERGPAQFVLMNDDFFCTQPVAGPPPLGHRGSLQALSDERLAGVRASAYGSMLRDTAVLLREAGHPEPLAYTLHEPMTMTADGLQLALDYGLRHRGSAPALSWRSLYGNLLRLGGEQREDVKVHGDGPMVGPWVSTSDASFRYHAVGRMLRKQLSMPSPYEHEA